MRTQSCTCAPAHRSHDALRAHGIIPERQPSRSPSPEPPSAQELKDAARRQATVEDLDEELEDADEDEERILQQLRAQRMKELSAMHAQARFGRVYPISRPDYTREVTDASKEAVPGSPDAAAGTGVVCFLYKPGYVTKLIQYGIVPTLGWLPGPTGVQVSQHQVCEHRRRSLHSELP